MRIWFCTLMPLLMFSLCSCELDTDTEVSTTLKIQELHLLLLKKESVLEVWTVDSLRQQKWKSFSLTKPSSYPIGFFEIHLSENGTPVIDFENEFYNKQSNRFAAKIKTNKKEDLFSLLIAEDAFTLRHQMELVQDMDILIVPNDSRSSGYFDPIRYGPAWLPELYSELGLRILEMMAESRMN